MKGSFWSLISGVAGQGFALLGSILTARYLGAEDFGRLGILLSTVSMFTVVGSFGLGITATKHIAQFRVSDLERTGRVLGMSSATALLGATLAATILILVAPWLAMKVLSTPTLVRELRISALILFFMSVNAYQIGALAGFEAFRASAVASLIRGIGGLPILVAGAAYGGLTGAVIAYGLATALSCITHAVVLRKQCRLHHVRISYHLQREDFSLLYRFGVPVLIAGMSYVPALWASNAALARAAGFHEVALFQAAFQWQTVCMFLAVCVGNVGFPMMAANLGSRRAYMRVLAGNYSLTTGLTLVTAALGALAAPYIARLYGPEFVNATDVIRIMCACAVVSAIGMSAGQVIWSSAASGAAMLFSLLRGTILVVMSLLLAGRGAEGLAWAHLITAVALILVEVPFSFHRLRRILAAAA